MFFVYDSFKSIFLGFDNNFENSLHAWCPFLNTYSTSRPKAGDTKSQSVDSVPKKPVTD